MNPLSILRMIEGAFGWLLTTSWQASALALLVLLLQRILGKSLNPRWRHALWLLVLLRLILPALPECSFSLFQFAPSASSPAVVSITESSFKEHPIILDQALIQTTEPTSSFSLFSIIAFVWAAGALILFARTWRIQKKFTRLIADSPKIVNAVMVKLLEKTKAELGVTQNVLLKECHQIKSPAIVGLFRPTLLLPRAISTSFTSSELRFIFLHELAHLKRGDLFIQFLMSILQVLHWFNPMLWFTFRRIRIDREPATDALVLLHTGEEEKENYGLMIIKILENFSPHRSLPYLVGILEEKEQFKDRFSQIARFTRNSYAGSLTGLLLVSFLSVGCLTKSKIKESDQPHKSIEKNVKDDSKKSVSIAFRLVQLDDEDYQNKKQRVDTAIAASDFDYFNSLKSANILVSPIIVAHPQMKSRLEIAKSISYPTEFKKEEGKFSPSKFECKNLGVEVEVTAALRTLDETNNTASQNIILYGKLTQTDFEGFTESAAAGIGMTPTFSTSEARFFVEVNDNQEKVLWLPYNRWNEVKSEERKQVYPTLDAQKKLQLLKKRYILFVKAHVVP